jgi:hypothetical protein
MNLKLINICIDDLKNYCKNNFFVHYKYYIY